METSCIGEEIASAHVQAIREPRNDREVIKVIWDPTLSRNAKLFQSRIEMVIPKNDRQCLDF